MDWGAVIQLTLAIVGAALIVGGIVAYRRSTRTGVRAFSSSAIAAGVTMLAVVLLSVSVSTTGKGPLDPLIEGAEAQYEEIDSSDHGELSMPPCCKKPIISVGDVSDQVSETDIEPNYPAIALGELTETECDVVGGAVYVTSEGETGCLDDHEVGGGGGVAGMVTPVQPPTIEPTQ